MISSLRGTVLSSTGTTAVIEVGGVGFSVTVTPEHAASLRVGTEATLVTTLIVRDDDLSLYGFSDGERLRVFDLLRGVTGVGPKSAMGVLSVMSPDEVARGVADDDDAAFRRVPGIGPKTAKLITVSLTGKLHPSDSPAEPSAPASASVSADVITALVGLGWTEKAAAKAAEDAMGRLPELERRNVAAVIRAALSALGPARRSTGGGA